MTSQPSFATYVKQSSSTKGNTQNHPSAVAHIPGLAVTVPNHLIYSRETLKLYRRINTSQYLELFSHENPVNSL